VRAFNLVPLDDDWYDGTSEWRGIGWHGMDFKAMHAIFAFGSQGQRRLAWERLEAQAQRVVRANYGRPGGRAGDNGLTMLSAGAYLDMIGRGLFGLEEHLDRIEISPHVDGIADDFTWRIEGWILGDDTLSVSYRPADRALSFRLGALTRRRVVVRVPWFGREGCVTARRGRDTEMLEPVFQADGSAYVDLRAFYDPAEVTVTARAC
jgi:hypothetical protein